MPVVPASPAAGARRSPRWSVLAVAAALCALALSSAPALAADAAGGGAPPAKQIPSGLISIILSNVDFVFCTIVALSIVGLTLIIQGFIKNRASVYMPQETTDQIREMVSQRKFKELIEFTETDDSFISRALNPALKRAPSFSSMKEAMETAIGEETADKFRGIEYLNIIGNLGPLLGLLGTVLGMINAFSDMQKAQGKADPSTLAGGISQALTHTFMGLFLAIPCLAAFGVLRTIVDRLTVRGALQAEELLLMIKPAEARPVAGVGGGGGGASMAGAVVPRPMAAPQPAVRKAPPMPTPAV
jgi:biopolymer transport protein ExbB